ncbi:hypothetical protein LINPERPRIM_LOCUS33263 [Linum perenne]
MACCEGCSTDQECYFKSRYGGWSVLWAL